MEEIKKKESDATDGIVTKTMENITEEENKAEKKKKRSESKKAGILEKKRKKYEKALTNDIRYRGPFSYRHFRIFAWLIMALIPLVFIFKMAAKLDAGYESDYTALNRFSSIAGALVVPFFLMANFAIILDKKNTYKQLIRNYSIFSAALVGVYFILYSHIIKGLAGPVSRILDVTENNYLVLFENYGAQGKLSFNVFIDLLMCTLFMYFLNYVPAKHFQGKKIKLFRMFALLPVLYEIMCIVLKILCLEDKIRLPLIIYPFMTVKPPMFMLFFVMMALSIRRKEKRFLATGLSHEQYREYLKTNTNSLHFSLRAVAFALICGVMDLIVSFIITIVMFVNIGGLNVTDIEGAQEIIFDYCFEAATKWGFYSFISLFAMTIPVLLFSYSKVHKNKIIDLFIPVGAILLMVVISLEGGFQVFRLFLQTKGMEMMDVIRELLGVV